VILHFGYPNDVALGMRQEQQNNIDVPVIDSGSMELAVGGGLVSGALLDRAYATVPCSSRSSDRKQMADYASAFKAKYGSSTPLPYSGGVATYDHVKLIAKAIEYAKSADPVKVNQAIGSISYTDGACQSTYKADGAHFLAHENVTVHYNSNGTAKVERTWKLPDTPKGTKP
jgi:ABC-type branched-subunit amino acid transport system substrate-binding protein